MMLESWEVHVNWMKHFSIDSTVERMKSLRFDRIYKEQILFQSICSNTRDDVEFWVHSENQTVHTSKTC